MAASAVFTDHWLPECLRALLETSLRASVSANEDKSLLCLLAPFYYRRLRTRRNRGKPPFVGRFPPYCPPPASGEARGPSEGIVIETARATAPENNVVVHAAAGTGKTWLLTSRILRLLLEGAEPGSIMAITFTRKAAGEIHQRVRERLLVLAACEEPELDRRLGEIGVRSDAAMRRTARGLYEKHLNAIHGLRATTFHAFCQEVLRRFPLEADVPPGFELLEAAPELEALALRQVEHLASRDPDGTLAEALDMLLRECGVHGYRAALGEFLAHRSDWWAYTEDEVDPVASAMERLRAQFELDETEPDPAEAFVRDPAIHERIVRCIELLAATPAAKHQEHAAALDSALAEPVPASAFDRIRAALLTQANTPRVLAQASLEKKFGPDVAQDLVREWNALGAAAQTVVDRRKRRAGLLLSQAWYRCGHVLLEEFQRLKLSRGLLDFSDLEWKTYRLLNRERHAEWVQYKLDQRIDHLLVDEFQDTNPTQWRMLLPLLQEIAAGDPERRRSIFLVGDEKQSIYRFRRADPRLFETARDWLTQHAAAHTLTQHVSWRSSPAVIEFVNLVFADSDDGEYALPAFEMHATHHSGLWGHAELLPLIRRPPRPEPTTAEWRNPLVQPRSSAEDIRHRDEAGLIVGKIRELLGQPIADGTTVRGLRCDDILILLRDRTYARLYEEALQRAGLAYVGTGKGSFLEALEIRDLMHLLRHLLEPFNDLALASILRSPLFDASDDELLQLSGHASGTWRERLYACIGGGAGDALERAARLLRRWSDYAGHLPVHDLLDRIYSEGDVLARYRHASPAHLRARVEANLGRFLELALEVDSGRYPSLARFLDFLEAHADTENPPPEDAPGQSEARVRLMTIHAAKGLEAPVVFLADAARDGNRDRGVRALVDWPAQHERPRYFHLATAREELDAVRLTHIQEQRLAGRREESNLLYVALTRAAQMLFVSGCESGRGGRGWYGFIEQRLRAAVENGHGSRVGLTLEYIRDEDTNDVYNTPGRIVYGSAPEHPTARAPEPPPDFTIDPALTRPIASAQAHDSASLAPSHAAQPSGPKDIPHAARQRAQQRGIMIHRMLDRLTGGRDARPDIERRLRDEFSATVEAGEFERCWQECRHLVEQERWRDYFDPARCRRAWNEVPILYRNGEREVYGVIDRLILRDSEVVLLDYKTHSEAAPENIDALAESHRAQMRQYAEGVRRLWPGRKVRAIIFFTACGAAVELGD